MLQIFNNVQTFRSSKNSITASRIVLVVIAMLLGQVTFPAHANSDDCFGESCDKYKPKWDESDLSCGTVNVGASVSCPRGYTVDKCNAWSGAGAAVELNSSYTERTCNAHGFRPNMDSYCVKARVRCVPD